MDDRDYLQLPAHKLQVIGSVKLSLKWLVCQVLVCQVLANVGRI